MQALPAQGSRYHVLEASEISPETGLAWTTPIPPGFGPGDENADLGSSTLLIYEDGQPLGPAHSVHDMIRATGKGAYSHWNGILYFSSSDGEDPRSGRRYLLLPDAEAAAACFPKEITPRDLQDSNSGEYVVEVASQHVPVDLVENRRLRLKLATEAVDPDWYLKAYPDAATLSLPPVEHYLRFGADEGRNPNPDFDTRTYLALRPGLKEKGINPLVYHLIFDRGAAPIVSPECPDDIGVQAEALRGSEAFDAGWYLAGNPDAAEAGADPVLHYLERSLASGRNPSVAFDARLHAALYPEAALSGLNPLVHFILADREVDDRG